MILTAVFVAVLLFCSAYFSACETAITAYSKPKMFGLAADGDKRASIIVKLQEEISRVISSILVCSTILNALAVAFTTEIFDNIFGGCALFLAPIITSMFIVLFSEVLPKMLTIANPCRVLLPSAHFIKYIHIALKPLNSVIGSISKCMISLIRRKPTEMDEYKESLDELRGAIALHKGFDVEDTEKEKEMLQSVLDLGTVQVSSIMIHRNNVTMYCADDSLEVLIEKVLSCPFTRIPLWSGDQDNIIGILHVTDLLKAIRKNRDQVNINISEIARKPWFIPENNDLLDQLQAFKRRHEHIAIVVDEYGSFMGIITLEDILEEIVGDIEDEHDVGVVSGIRLQDDGSYIVDGSINIRDLNREIYSKFGSDVAATVAGYVINSVGIIPDIGQTFILHGYKFEVLKRHRNQISLLRITSQEKGETDDTEQ
ncbi:MAG: CNNM domain-containing protein [Holosporales bacterium]|jgi:Mg2+/Co2+ transporter CorB|nr:CNNM domain-containing protein [Holosporales bacterium]